MSFSNKSVCLALAVALASPAAIAQQSQAGDAAAAPAHAAAHASITPSTRYKSAFDGYRRFADEPVQPWRQANDTVGRIGGWMTYAREAQANDAESATPAAQTGTGQGRGVPGGQGAHKSR